jgi:hypothetical protein
VEGPEQIGGTINKYQWVIFSHAAQLFLLSVIGDYGPVLSLI